MKASAAVVCDLCTKIIFGFQTTCTSSQKNYMLWLIVFPIQWRTQRGG